MNKPLRLCLLTALGTGLFATGVQGDSMRCGSHIISTGQRDGIGKYEVLKRCGEPTERRGNVWIYDEPGKPRRALRFGADGALTDIDTLN